MSELSKVLGEGGLVVTSLFGFKFRKGRADRVTRTIWTEVAAVESRAFWKAEPLERIDSVLTVKSSKV